jgi:hypothetical protein
MNVDYLLEANPDPHLSRTLLQMMLIFRLMLIALILPIKSFLKRW